MAEQIQAPVIVWFREDLRLADQPALAAAVAMRAPLLCVYIFDEDSADLRPLGGASRWWLHGSLAALAASLEAIGGRLDILEGPGAETIEALAVAAKAQRVVWTRRYGGAEIAIDETAKKRLRAREIEAESFNGLLLHEPWTVKTGAGGPFKVYTPFWRAARALPAPPEPTGAPRKLHSADWPRGAPRRAALDKLGLLPTKPDWAGGLREAWEPGEAGARKRLRTFIDDRLKDYAGDRDKPARHVTSNLSPHLRFGELSPRQALAAVHHAQDAHKAAPRSIEKFLGELGWREFNHQLLFHWPDLASKNFNERFDALPWRKSYDADLRAWQKGLTGYPIVDAGMRELWTTGVMHNRVRLICASFLVKDLLIDWREGERWFWDTLVDADPANNPGNWQWVAGSGADAAPYFRIFNPVLQGAKFDADGAYVKRYVPELAKLDAAYIHKPWTAPDDALAGAGVTLGTTYPKPIVDHAKARERALAALSSIAS